MLCTVIAEFVEHGSVASASALAAVAAAAVGFGGIVGLPFGGTVVGSAVVGVGHVGLTLGLEVGFEHTCQRLVL